MNRRISRVCVAVILAATVGFAADQTEAKESKRPRIRFGGFMVGAGYSHGSRYGWPYGYYAGGPWAYPGYLWDPFFYGLWAYPGFFTGYGYNPNFGEIKLAAPDKTASVFINGGYAGLSGKLKDIWLEPGAYDIEVRSGAGQLRKRVYVLSGKTVKLDMRALGQEERP